MGSPTDPNSEEQYFHKVSNMLLECNDIARKLFSTRWKTETMMDWAHTNDQAEAFIKGPVGKIIYKNANKTQKEMMCQGRLIDWDMSVLASVLYNFGDREKYSKENGVVRELMRVRNNMAHHPHKTITIEEYNTSMQIIKEALMNVVTERDVEKMIYRAGITSSVDAMEKVNRYLEDADKLKASGKFREAISVYSDAIKVPSLIQVHLAGLFEKRTECYLKLDPDNASGYDDVNVMQACDNIQQSLACHENSPTAHQIAAQCYRRQHDFRKAILSYEQSLILSPTQKSVKNELEGCKILAGIPVRLDSSFPLPSCLMLDEQMRIYNANSSSKLSPAEYFEKKIIEAENAGQGQDHVIRGQMYFHGWTVDIHLEQASKLFSSANHSKNPEGTYNLGLCYQLGKGVAEDINQAIMYYKSAASAHPDAGGEKTKTGKNLGVAIAQHTLASLYQNGKVSPMGKLMMINIDEDSESEEESGDIKKAMEWYEKATINGFGHSANNLACIYYEGRKTIPANEKKAVEYWRKGAELEDANSVVNLMTYYAKHMEPRQVKKLWKTWKSMDIRGQDRQVISDQEFEENVMEPCITKRNENDGRVSAFEAKYKLTSYGTFLERLNRLKKIETADQNSIDEILNNMRLEGNAERRKAVPDTCEQEITPKPKPMPPVTLSSTANTLPEISAERLKVILGHRKKFDKTAFIEPYEIRKGKLTQTFPKGLAGVKPIALEEMKPEDELIYENRHIDLMLIEDLWISPAGVIHSVGQDLKRDVIPVQFHSLSNPQTAKHNFVCGSNISIFNPYIQFIGEQRILRNDLERCIISLSNVVKVCRCCGQQDVKGLKRCPKCMRANYCNNDCRERDWNILQHKLVCSKR